MNIEKNTQQNIQNQQNNYEYIWKDGMVQKNTSYVKPTMGSSGSKQTNQQNIDVIINQGIKIGKIQRMTEQDYKKHLLSYWKLNQLEEKNSIMWENLMMPVGCLHVIFRLKRQKKLFQDYLTNFRKWEQQEFDNYMEQRKCLQNQKIKTLKLESTIRDKINLSIIQSVNYLGQSESQIKYSVMDSQQNEGQQIPHLIGSKNLESVFIDRKTGRDQHQLVNSIQFTNNIIKENNNEDDVICDNNNNLDKQQNADLIQFEETEEDEQNNIISVVPIKHNSITMSAIVEQVQSTYQRKNTYKAIQENESDTSSQYTDTSEQNVMDFSSQQIYSNSNYKQIPIMKIKLKPYELTKDQMNIIKSQGFLSKDIYEDIQLADSLK